MRQYLEIKDKYSDCILFFRLGDFYEMFFDDAVLASRLLELTLTGHASGQKERAPMCGVPFHAADSYISRLVDMGYKVAICEQLEDPATVKGMVKRGVIRVVTPGTVTSDRILKENENNYLASCVLERDGMAVAVCDLSTGELRVTEEVREKSLFDDMINEIVNVSAREILVNETVLNYHDADELRNLTGAFVDALDETYYSPAAAEEAIKARFNDLSLTALGLEGRPFAVRAVGALLAYVLDTQKQDIKQITHCQYYELNGRMVIDKASLRNLEITESLFDRRVKGSLLGVLDRTKTAMGGRMIRKWLREPLNDPVRIRGRLDAVETLTGSPLLMNNISEALKSVYDLERLGGRAASGNANGRDLIALRDTAGSLPDIIDALEGSGSELLEEIREGTDDLHDIYEKISSAVRDDPPLTIRDGGIIREGYSEELDSLKNSIKDAKNWIASLDRSEKERTGITHLKVGYNKVFGYYIEVSRSNLDMVPDDYIRKQTLVGAERFITPKLKETENLVLNAEDKINRLEYELFTSLRNEIGLEIERIQRTSHAVAALDVILSFASVSLKNGYVKPHVDSGTELKIRNGRHPVIEQADKSGMFVANDTELNTSDRSLLVITGPNMSGKSTYMRQTALIVLMAQAGCFVPADSAEIGVVDRIFTRIGASDNLSQGQSTFFVEMSELAYILRNAGPESLIILDEIGRGTSTYDGLAIAWATVEYLSRKGKKIRTLFATHYHELTEIENRREGVRNLNVDVSDEGGSIVFLHKIVPGPASRSYGIHVARLAGVPVPLLENAEKKLARLEEEGVNSNVSDAFASEIGETGKYENTNPAPEPVQLSFFREENPVLTKVRNLDIMNLTPAGAIQILTELKDSLDQT